MGKTSKPPRRLRGKAAKLAVLAVAAYAIFAYMPRLRPAVATLLAARDVERRALEILRREELRFLATDRVGAQVVVESDEGSFLLGRREGCLIAKVALHYGVDLGKLTEANIVREGDGIVVIVPDPEELDFAVDLDSMRYLTRRSGLQVAADWLLDRDQRKELRARFKDAAYSHLRSTGSLPERRDVVARLNRHAAILSGRLGVGVRLR